MNCYENDVNKISQFNILFSMLYLLNLLHYFVLSFQIMPFITELPLLKIMHNISKKNERYLTNIIYFLIIFLLEFFGVHGA